MIVNLQQQTQYENYWKGERLVIVFASDDPVHMWTNLQGDYNDPIAIYQVVDHKVIVDMTEYVRAHASSITKIFFAEFSATPTTYELRLTIKGLINPAGVIIPYHYEEQYAPVIAPLTMYAPKAGVPLVAELYITTSYYSVTGNITVATNKRSASITGDFTFAVSGGGDARKYAIKQRVCGVQYAYVRWQSFSGVTRTHIFEVTKPKTESADSYTLMPVDNEYNEIKGRVDGFTLRLNNLFPYDIWYYSDVITSSKVEVSLDDGMTYDQVQVTTKNIILPDGDTKQNGKLEIAVNWKRYDAVTM